MNCGKLYKNTTQTILNNEINEVLFVCLFTSGIQGYLARKSK